MDVREVHFGELSWRTIVHLVRNHKGKLVGEHVSDNEEEEEDEHHEQV